MKANKIIEAIMELKGTSKAALGRAVGVEVGENDPKSKPTDVISKRLKQKSMSIEIVAEMVEKMDYQVLIVPSGVTVQKGWYKVEKGE